MKVAVTFDHNTSGGTVATANLLYSLARVKMTATALPSGASLSTYYYPRMLSDTAYTLHTTQQGAYDGSNLVSFADDGSGIELYTTDISQTFFYRPSQSSEMEAEPKIRKVQFGDGYEQRSKDGINNNPLTFHCNFMNISSRRAHDVSNFLKDLEGYKWFWWMAPEPYDDSLKKFVAGKHSIRYDAPNIRTITVDFKQSFEPGA